MPPLGPATLRPVHAPRGDPPLIVARKHSILAPFERITWNQWQHFQLDENPSQPQPRASDWGDPRGSYCWHVADVPWTATGPAGEKLYDIQIAPGTRSAIQSQFTEQEVIGWLANLLREHPDESPQPLGDIRQLAMRHCPGLSMKSFDYCYVTACKRTGNYNWSKPGRRKSPRKPLQPPQSRGD